MGASKRRLGDVSDHREDEKQLCFECQHHKCGSYCMRNHRRKKNKTRHDKMVSTTDTAKKTSAKGRYCRAGAGYEATPNKCDTPGFQLRSHHSITRDDRDFLRLEMKRNSLRMIQTPLHALRGWRGNCDIKILLYDCHEGEPTPEDIAEVTDYVVAYACKGNETLAVERETLKTIIMRYVPNRDHMKRDQPFQISKIRYCHEIAVGRVIWRQCIRLIQFYLHASNCMFLITR